MNAITDKVQSASPNETAVEFGLTTLSRIYLGRRVPIHNVPVRPDGVPDWRQATVTDVSVGQFIDKVIALRFPDGFTVLRGDGGWLDQMTGRPIREASLIVEVIHGKSQAGKVREVAETWKKWFGQDAAMIVSTPINAEFV